jgi:hypothetical protein
MATNPVLGGIEQIILLVFVLMVLVGMAGGNPASVLSPVLQMATQLFVSMVSLAFSLLGMLAKALISLIPALVQSIGSRSQSACSRRNR